MSISSFWKLGVYILAVYFFANVTTGSSMVPVDRVIGGTAVKPGEYPAQVSLHFGKVGHYCGGSLITLSDVLTAAHCLFYGPRILQEYVIVVAGEFKSKIVESSSLQMLPMKNVVMHPFFDCKTLENDIGIVKIAGTFIVTEFVRPWARVEKRPQIGNNCEILGWGSTSPLPNGDIAERLQRAWVEVQLPYRCGSIFNKMPFHEERMICAGALQERGICSGDLGGPLICNGQIAGITSAGLIPCGIKGLAGRFTDVTSYKMFIDMFVEWDGEGLPPFEKYSSKDFFCTGGTYTVAIILLVQAYTNISFRSILLHAK